MMQQDLIQDLITSGYLKSKKIIKAFQKIKREDFVPEHLKSSAYQNEPLSIGYGATISQPLTVAFLLELLEPKAGDKVLDIGSGSGWQSALLADIVGPKGFIFAIERIRELKEFGENNVKKYKLNNTQFIHADGSIGFEQEAPYDKIIAAAAIQDKIPQSWRDQMKIGGRMVVPIKNSIWLIIKKSKTEFEEKEYSGFVFVPLISEYHDKS